MPCFFFKWNICITNANFKTTHLFGSVACLSIRSWLPAIQAAYCIASIPASQQCSSTHHTCKVSSAAMSINQNYLILCSLSTPKNTDYQPLLAFFTTHMFQTVAWYFISLHPLWPHHGMCLVGNLVSQTSKGKGLGKRSWMDAAVSSITLGPGIPSNAICWQCN